MQPDEAALLMRALKQDAVAYGEIVKRYEKAMYHHCFSIVHDEDRPKISLKKRLSPATTNFHRLIPQKN